MAGTVRVSWIRRFCILWTFSIAPFPWAQEFRSTTTVTSASQPVTIDLSNVSDVRGASISIHNSGSSTVLLPQISTPNNLMPISGPAILAQLNSLPPVSTDQDRAIQAWQFVLDHSFPFCLSGAKGDPGGWARDPIEILNSFGFGCCDQLAQTLAWIWQQEGYPARVALFPFHAVPEIFYNNAWHMLDPDHRVYYPKDDGTIASVAEILADTNLIARTADADGKDPVGWLATTMADLYAQNAGALQYVAPFYAVGSSSGITLRPHESITFRSENWQDSTEFYADGAFLAPAQVGSAKFNWDLSFANGAWKQLASSLIGVDVITDISGNKLLVDTTTNPGFLVYKEGSMFPVFALSVSAQLGGASPGSLQAFFSRDGVNWSAGVPFIAEGAGSSFDLKADLSDVAYGSYSYFVKVQLNGGMQVHRLRISPIVQTSWAIFPVLSAASSNQLLYRDSSPATQSRLLQVTTAIPSGTPQIRGLHAESLIEESPTYSVTSDYGAANLVDGDPDSLAYPGSTHLDYVIQLNGSYNVSSVSIDWGYFGSDPRYVQSWQILGRTGNQPWQLLASGGFPGEATQNIFLSSTATELRLVADSTNWIGTYDVRVFGSLTAPALSPTTWTIRSNVLEDPVYSIGQHYGATNLIDGNSSSLAYPASQNIDYQISLGATLHISSANIIWGYFGSDARYISSWSLLTRNGAGQPWIAVAQGGFPNSATTQVSFDVLATDVRIVAGSTKNWIGIYDLQLNGAPVISGLTASSNVQEQTSQPSFQPAANLVDGDETTFAYPGSVSVDYNVDLGQRSYIDAVKIVWGSFGSISQFVQSWRLLGLRADGNWEVAARGGFPNSTETVVPVHNPYRILRVAANGPNWLGINELQVFGSSVPPPGSFTVKSNVVEDPTYSLARGYQASNLIDGDPATLAYPASTHLDYQVSLGQPMQLSSAFINWGVFGTNSIYITSWSLLARNGADQPWVTLASGGFPNTAGTLLNLDFSGTDVRIIADSPNWIGIHELTIKGAPLH